MRAPTRAPEGECIATVFGAGPGKDGAYWPCEMPATGWAHDPEDADVHPDGGWFPACDEHRQVGPGGQHLTPTE